MSQVLVNSVLTGGLYAALGVGLCLVYGVSRVVNAAHGAYIVLGAYLAWTAWSLWGFDPLLVAPALGLLGFGLGYAIQRGLINAVIRRSALMTVALTFGVDLVIVTVVLLTWGADLRIVQLPYAAGGAEIAGVRIPYIRAIVFGLALASALALELIVRRTAVGARIRAVAQDRAAAELLGIDVGHTYGVAHGLAAATACGSGALVATIIPLQPFLGISLLLIAFAVAVLAGFGPIAPVVVAGFLLALAEQMAGTYIGPEYQRLSIFAAYLVIATIRPNGLFGTRFYAH